MLKKIISIKYIQVLFLFLLFCFSFLFIRNLIEENSHYNFLIWNVFLGFTPFLFSFLIYIFEKNLNNLILIAGSSLWLLFYPNAPYMISDLIHIQATSTTVVYDTLLIFSFSMLSLFFGFYSIKLIQNVINKRASKKITNTIIIISLLLSSFGIYLGRVLRLNSWDVFTEPLKTLSTIFEHLFPITKNPVTYIIIILFTFIQGFILLLMQDIDDI